MVLAEQRAGKAMRLTGDVSQPAVYLTNRLSRAGDLSDALRFVPSGHSIAYHNVVIHAITTDAGANKKLSVGQVILAREWGGYMDSVRPLIAITIDSIKGRQVNLHWSSNSEFGKIALVEGTDKESIITARDAARQVKVLLRGTSIGEVANFLPNNLESTAERLKALGVGTEILAPLLRSAEIMRSSLEIS